MALVIWVAASSAALRAGFSCRRRLRRDGIHKFTGAFFFGLLAFQPRLLHACKRTAQYCEFRSTHKIHPLVFFELGHAVAWIRVALPIPVPFAPAEKHGQHAQRPVSCVWRICHVLMETRHTGRHHRRMPVEHLGKDRRRSWRQHQKTL